MTKTGVLTFHRCINYGSYWQSRALVDGLRARGHDAELLDHHSRKVNLAEWKCAYRPTLPSRVDPADYAHYRRKVEKFFECFDDLPRSKTFDLDDPSSMDSYDTVVVGSDEVWNLSHPWYGGVPLFFGKEVKTASLVSYAASFGNYDSSWGLGRDWAEQLRRFKAISVRDANSQVIISLALGVEPDLVLDPCLQFPIEPEQRIWYGPSKRYIAVYGHNFSRSFVTNVRKWAADQDLVLASVGYRNDWADEHWIDADPHDFARFIANAESVATNFFHGCVFSLANAKPFVCEASPYRAHKLSGLVTKTGADEHLTDENSAFERYAAALRQPLDEKISARVNELRHRSNAYIDRALA